MNSGLISFIIWTMIFIGSVNRANSQQGKIDGKTYKFHIFFAWFLLMMNNTAFKMLGWAVGHPDEISSYFYINLGPIPAWFNLSTWIGYSAISIGAMILAFSLVKRKDGARKIFIYAFPLYYFFTFAEMLKGFYKTDTDIPLLIAVAITAIMGAIPSVPMFFFYKSKKVRERIFTGNNGEINESELVAE